MSCWHFEILAVNARRFVDGQSYASRDPYATILTIQFKNGRECYISGMLNDGTRGPMRGRDWMELRTQLRRVFGVELIESERHGEDKSYDTGPAPLS